MGTRQKIGTALDSKVIRFLRQRSRNTGRPVNQIIEEAVLARESAPVSTEATVELRLRAMRRFLESGPRPSRKVVDEILAEDPYDQ